jgi:predicted nucleic acid-binding protein
MTAEVFLDSNILLYTEDLNHGQDYSGVKAINPFYDRQ